MGILLPWSWLNLGAVPAGPLTVPGLEYTLITPALEVTAPQGRLHFAVPEDRLHVGLPDEDEQ